MGLNLYELGFSLGQRVTKNHAVIFFWGSRCEEDLEDLFSFQHLAQNNWNCANKNDLTWSALSAH